MMKKLDLAGSWNFAMDASKEGMEKKQFLSFPEDRITLPGTISMAKKGTPSDNREIGALTDPYLFEGYAWYVKEITLDETDLEKEIYLYLERTRLTKIWIDDTFAGEFDSLNTPHNYYLTKFIKHKTFRLSILVSNVDYPTPGGHLTSPDTQTNWNGIIGEIALHIFEPVHITNIKTYPDIDTKSVSVTFDTVNTGTQPVTRNISAKAVLTDISGDTDISAPEAVFPIEFPGRTT